MYSQIALGITLFAAAAIGAEGQDCDQPARSAVVAAKASAAGAVVAAKASAAGTVACPIVFDGRVPVDTELVDFDKTGGLFSPDFVKGKDLKFSEILEFPAERESRFDNTKFKPVHVTITDDSIFNNQTGFRRAELLFGNNSGTVDVDPSTKGVMTMHWSVKQDAKQALDFAHEYLTVFHEVGDFSGNHFNFLAGTLIAGVPEGGSANEPDTWKVLDRKNKQIFTTPIVKDKWQNFAITMNMVDNTLQVFASQDNNPLVAVTKPVPNDNSGGGQFHTGVLKKPTGATGDITKNGDQASGILEGLTYGGVFVENSADGCISL